MAQLNQILRNRYRIDAPLGKGGMGTVHRAFDLTLQIVCVVKELIIPPGSTQSLVASAVDQFRREAQMLAQLQHANLPRVSDYFQDGNNYYLVMDFVAGTNLESMIGGGMSESAALKYGEQLLAALEYIHSQNVLHRDIKPQNIIVKPNGQVMLVDFGLAKSTSGLTMQFLQGMGTPEYTPPEQYTGGTDVRSDLYSASATLYHLMAGQAPVSAGDQMAGMALPNLRQLKPAISANTANAITRAMQLDRNKRFQNITEFLQVLKGGAAYASPNLGAQSGSQPTYPPPVGQAQPGKVNRTPLLIGGLVAIAGLCLGGAMLYIALGTNASTPRPGAPTRGAAEAITPAPADTVAPASTDAPAPTLVVNVPTPVAADTTEPKPVLSTVIPDTPAPDAPTEAPPTPKAPLPASSTFIFRTQVLGRSAGGRNIALFQTGDEAGSGPVIFVIGGIAGEQYDTHDPVNELVAHYQSSGGKDVPTGALLYLIPDINPDGGGANRMNANRVDLNRNWANFNWTADPPVAGVTTRGAGGSSSFSEPETRALRDLIQNLRRAGREVRVVVLHSSANRNHREVFPGYTAAGVHASSRTVANRVKDELGFKYDTTSDQPTTGEVIAWCGEQDIVSIDIFWSRPDRNRPDLNAMLRVIGATTQ